MTPRGKSRVARGVLIGFVASVLLGYGFMLYTMGGWAVLGITFGATTIVVGLMWLLSWALFTVMEEDR